MIRTLYGSENRRKFGFFIMNGFIMDKSSINFYKYDFPTLTQSVASKKVSPPTAVSDFEQLTQVQNSSKSIENLKTGKSIIAPQGLGELKHSAISKGEYSDFDIPNRKVKGITEAIVLSNDKKSEQEDDFFFKPPKEVRHRIEEEVRKRKQA